MLSKHSKVLIKFISMLVLVSFISMPCIADYKFFIDKDGNDYIMSIENTEKSGKFLVKSFKVSLADALGFLTEVNSCFEYDDRIDQYVNVVSKDQRKDIIDFLKYENLLKSGFNDNQMEMMQV